MSKRDSQIPAALKHGIYSGLKLLPGEDPAAFRKLHSELIAEFTPTGPAEESIVASLAALTWRKENLSTYRLAQIARDRYSEIRSKLVPPETSILDSWADARDPEEVQAAEETAREQALKELGPVAWELVTADNVATTGHLLEELTLMDRLDGMIDRCIKRLLMVRGVKSISPSLSGAATPPAPSRKQIAA